MKDMYSNKLCYLCGAKPANTKDHLSPKGLFSKLPACSQGNTVRIMEGSDVFRAVDAEGLSKTVMPYLGEDPLVRIHHLQPGTEIKGKILFEIPKGASSLKIKYITIWQVPLAEWEIE